MKGKLAIGTVVALLIAVIVISIAVYFLVFVKNFDPYFLDPSKYKLIRYATCSLAMCGNGADSKQVNNIGCLEYEGGRCVKTCHDVKNELIIKNKLPESEAKGNICGDKNAIEFELDKSFPVNIKSGEIQTLSNPKWACRGIFLAGVRLYLPAPTGIVDSYVYERIFGNCLMWASLDGKEKTPLGIPIGRTEDSETAKGTECFTKYDPLAHDFHYEKVIFTPLIPIGELNKMTAVDKEAVYPASLYLTDKFNKGGTECELANGPVLISGNDKKDIEIFSQCKLKASDEKGSKKFKVWSEKYKHRNLPLIDLNNCAYSVLDKEEAVYPFTSGKTLSSSLEQIFPALVASNGNLYLFFQEADSINQQGGVFTVNPGKDSTIRFAESSSGDFTSFQGKGISDLTPYPNSGTRFLQPSATVLNGHRYLAYATNLAKGETYDIMVKDLDGGANLKGAPPERATDDKVDQSHPSIAALGDKLYLFYEQDLPNLPSEIYYKVGTVTGDRVKWSEAKLFGPGWQSPSVAPVPDGLMITYSFDCGANSPLNSKPSFGGKPRFGQAGKTAESTKGTTACENGVGAAIFKDDNFQDAGIVESGSETYGVSKPIAIGSDIFVFFDRGGESKRIFYSKYLGEGKWQESSPAVPYSSRSQVMPSLAEFGGGLTLAFSELGDNYDIRTSSLKGDLSGGSSPVASPPQQSGGQESAKSLTISTAKDSYKQGETVNVEGALGFGSSSSEGQEVKLRLRLKLEVLGSVDVEDFPKTAIVGKDGSFAVDYKLAQNAATGEYTVAAEYGRNVATHKFTVK